MILSSITIAKEFEKVQLQGPQRQYEYMQMY